MINKKVFNLIIAGYGGQGVLTMAKIIASAAVLSGYDVKQAELHGLAQRGGSLICQIRFGKNIYSPLIRCGNSDLIIGLDLLETLHACYFSDKRKTIILSNAELFNPYFFEQKYIDSQKIIENIKEFAYKADFVSVEKNIKKITKDTTMVNTFMLGYSFGKKIMPIKEKHIIQAMKEKFKKMFWENNLKIFHLGKTIAQT